MSTRQRQRRDRLALSLLAEPGDPRLVDLLAEHAPGEVVRAVRRGGVLDGVRLPAAWCERASGLDDLLDSAVTRGRDTGQRWICPGDSQWPTALDDLAHVEVVRDATGPPLGLWVRGRGDLAALSEHAVAVVGARACTSYGAEQAAEVSADLADRRITVVSGAAFGIDAAAHRGALSLDRPTIAVLAGGADVDYPRAHAALLARIAHDGLVVSEQAPGERALRSRFLSRNRIIAGLGAGTLVVEAARRSGSLNTLHWADALGRVAMGLPGPVTSRGSDGVHEAIRDGRAVLVTSAAEVVEEIGGLGAPPAGRPSVTTTPYDALAPAARRTLDALAWERPLTTAEVAAAAHLTQREVREHLADLATQGYAERLGRCWTLARRADVAQEPPTSATPTR